MKTYPIIKNHLRRAAMTLLVMVLTIVIAEAQNVQGVDYVDEYGTLKNTMTDHIEGNDSPTVLTGEEGELSAGWYVMNSDISYGESGIPSHQVVISGDVTIILADGCTMSQKCDCIFEGGTLTIYGQSEGSGTIQYENYPTVHRVFYLFCSSTNIYGGNINVSYLRGSNVTIGGGSVNLHDGGIWGESVNISGGSVNVFGNSSGFSGDQITISGGNVHCDCPQGIQVFGFGSFTLGWDKDTDRIYANCYSIDPRATFNIDEKKAFTDEDGTIHCHNNIGDIGGKTLKPLTAITMHGNTTDNSNLIALLDGVWWLEVGLEDISFDRSGNWNTLCLPFTIIDIDKSIFCDAEILEVDEVEFSGSTMIVRYHEPKLIVAGRPYFVKWRVPDDPLREVTFNKMDIVAADRLFENRDLQLKGTYDEVQFTEDELDILILGGDNKLHCPTGNTLGAFHAYFKLNTPSSFTQYELKFEWSGVNGITTTDSVEPTDKVWFDLSGRRLDGKPSRAGVYIVNGKKTVIK